MDINQELTYLLSERWSQKFPVGKGISQSLKSPMVEIEDFVLTLSAGYDQLTTGASIIRVEDTKRSHLTCRNKHTTIKELN